MLTPRLVTSKDLDFTTNHYLGLASLLVEVGYKDAELFIKSLKDLIDYRSVYDLLKVFIAGSTPSIALCSLALLCALNPQDRNQWVTNLIITNDKRLKALIQEAYYAGTTTIDNYNQVLTRFGYSSLNIDEVLLDPYLYIDWVATSDPTMSTACSSLLNNDLTQFIIDIVKIKTKADITSSPSKLSEVRRWANLTFSKYAFGASIDQSRWF